MIVIKVRNISHSEEIEVADKIQNFLNDNGIFPSDMGIVTQEKVDKSSLTSQIANIVGDKL